MEQGVSAEYISLGQRSGEGLYDYLQKIKEKEEHEEKEKGKKNGQVQKIEGYPDKGKQEVENNTEENKPSLADKLLEALRKEDPSEVWELVENNQAALKMRTLKSLDKVCVVVEKKVNNKEKRCNCNHQFDCSTILCCRCCGCCKCSCATEKQNNNQQQAVNLERGNEQQNNKAKNNEDKWKWIEILSNPMFISVEWLWRRSDDFKCEVKGRRKGDRNVDIVKAALDNAYLLEKIASYEHYYSQDEYKSAINSYEKFAVDIIEGTTSKENYDVKIMDIEGNGCLLTGQPKNFIESLSLLKIAANKGRKKFVASPRSQFILNEIIYYKWEDWQDESTVKKILWFVFQFFVLIAIITPFFYIWYRVHKKIRSTMHIDNIEENDKLLQQKSKPRCEWRIESLYEHPYSKFINHTMSYIVFVSLLIGSTFGFESEYRTSTTGLSRIDYAVLGFVVGLFFQEFWEAFKQGFYRYFSKWWNIVDTVTLFMFLASYVMWIIAWGSYGEWQPRRDPFIVADVLYASACVMAFFHLTHFFQVNSTLGPLQLSLYRMLKDVLKFLVIFLMLYIAFATGVVKVYSYYVASQINLRDHNKSHYQEYHPYAKHENTLMGLVWLLVGYVEEDKIAVDDPAFYLTSSFGRLGLVAYVVCTAIVALNMLIAMMNNSFDRVMNDADVEWKFSRAQMWLEWIDKGNAIPVPFNILYYALYVLLFVLFVLPCWIVKRCKKGRWPCYETVQSQLDCTAARADVEHQGRLLDPGRTLIDDSLSFERTNEQTTETVPLAPKTMAGSVELQAYGSCYTTVFNSQLKMGSEIELVQVDVMQGNGDQTLNHCCTSSCCSSSSYNCFCRSAVKADDVAQKERMDAMEYLVRRYVNDHYLAGFEGKCNTLMSTMESETNAGTSQVEIIA
ncbi:hypothetical protein ACROYT_G003036 [Oculina patagonica]